MEVEVEKIPKWSEAYVGYIAGVISFAALAFMYWRSQTKPPANG
jgi:hypothetical protein